MRYVFILLLAIHGLIHLIGFAKAFFLTDISKQVLGLSKPIGSFWLITFIIIMVAIVQFITHKKWFYLALLAVFISQILISLAWQDAKFGTILNIIILLVSISAFGHHRFQKMVNKESLEILRHSTLNNVKVISEKDIKHLPEIIKTWLRDSGVIGHKEIITVRLKQKGEMRTKPNSKRMPFDVTQYFNVEDPSFVWNTDVAAMPIIKMVGRDKLVDGNGEMLIKIASLIPVVNEGNNEKMNQGAMSRYLAEICWFPSAALNNYMTWESIDKTSAIATFTYKDHSVSGVFSFNTEGDLVSFEADRYYGGGTDAKLEKWMINVVDYKTFEGIKIPNKCKVTWKLKEDDFNWLNLTITNLEYNKTQPFKTIIK